MIDSLIVIIVIYFHQVVFQSIVKIQFESVGLIHNFKKPWFVAWFFEVTRSFVLKRFRSGFHRPVILCFKTIFFVHFFAFIHLIVIVINPFDLLPIIRLKIIPYNNLLPFYIHLLNLLFLRLHFYIQI